MNICRFTKCKHLYSVYFFKIIGNNALWLPFSLSEVLIKLDIIIFLDVLNYRTIAILSATEDSNVEDWNRGQHFIVFP